jgi:hypothetical protein
MGSKYQNINLIGYNSNWAGANKSVNMGSGEDYFRSARISEGTGSPAKIVTKYQVEGTKFHSQRDFNILS